MKATTYLLDTSAWKRSNANEDLSAYWTGLTASLQVALCPPVRLELLYSARSPADYARFADELDGLRSFPLTRRAVDRAAHVQAQLASRGQHRGPSPVDLYVAAIAEVHDIPVVHYDRDFDAIAQITGQQAEWIAPRGTLD